MPGLFIIAWTDFLSSQRYSLTYLRTGTLSALCIGTVPGETTICCGAPQLVSGADGKQHWIKALHVFLVAVKMFNVRENGFPCKAWLAGCTEARRTLPSSSLASCRVTREPDGFFTLCLKIRVSQLAIAQRGSGNEVVRGAGGRGWQPTCYTVPGNPNSPQVPSKEQKAARLACREYMGGG